MADAGELPTRLAILPFRNRVLLPGAIVRIQCTSPSSVKLIEQELWQKEEKGVIGVLPVKDAAAAAAASRLSPDAGSDAEDPVLKGPDDFSDSDVMDGQSKPEPVHWHKRGVVARALHLSRGVEKPSGRITYVVVLEGLSRFGVQELNTTGMYYSAQVSHLDMTKAEVGQAEQDPDIILLSCQFKATAMQLIAVLKQKHKAIGRVKDLLGTVPVNRLSDIFVASFEISYEEQLSMLDCVDLKLRLLKATEIVGRHLQIK